MSRFPHLIVIEKYGSANIVREYLINTPVPDLSVHRYSGARRVNILQFYLNEYHHIDMAVEFQQQWNTVQQLEAMKYVQRYGTMTVMIEIMHHISQMRYDCVVSAYMTSDQETGFVLQCR